MEEGPAAGSDKWITDGIHPPGKTGPVDNRIRDRLPTRITKKFRFPEKVKKNKNGERQGYALGICRILTEAVHPQIPSDMLSNGLHLTPEGVR